MRTRPVLDAAIVLVMNLAAVTATAQQNDINGLPWLKQQAPSQTAPQSTPQAVTPAAPVAPASQGPPPASNQPAAAPPPPPATEVKGSAQVLDTGNLIVQGRSISLFGVRGLGPPYDTQLASYLAAQGGAVECIPQADKYVCKTASGYDVAAAALFNGGARATSDAPPDYIHQQDLARAARRGVWARQR